MCKEANPNIVSEPIGKYAEFWTPVPEGSFVRVRGGEIEVVPFRPEA